MSRQTPKRRARVRTAPARADRAQIAEAEETPEQAVAHIEATARYKETVRLAGERLKRERYEIIHGKAPPSSLAELNGFIAADYSQHVITVSANAYYWQPRATSPIEVKLLSYGDEVQLPAERLHVEIRETDHERGGYPIGPDAAFVIYADNLPVLVAAFAKALDRARDDGLIPPELPKPAREAPANA